MIAEVNGISLFYEKTGQGPPLLLLHGNGEDHTIFDVAVGPLSDHFTVYAVDSRSHGQSTYVPALHYTDMAEDIAALIHSLALEKPIVYGFSDGGIVALLVAIAYPDLLGKIIASGANVTPDGMAFGILLALRVRYLFRRSSKIRLMLTQPHITKEMLGAIRTPTVILAGERDIIREQHTRAIAAAIPGCKLEILPGEDHGSYIVHSDKLYGVLAYYLFD